jgi:hypothetical protein
VTACHQFSTELLGNRQGKKMYKRMGESKGVLFVQVLDVHEWSDEIYSFTVTDGTFFVNNFHLDESEWHSTQEVRIIVLDPSPLLKKIKVNISVICCFFMSFKFTLPWCYQTIYINIQL